MTLIGGAKLGPYAFLSPPGVGGMGEIYHARNMLLKRILSRR